MPVICPAILAKDAVEYKQQINKVASFAHRLQIDLTDGKFAPTHTIKPELVWWPAAVKADIHLMYKHPLLAAKVMAKHKPHLIISHAEADGSFDEFASFCQQHGIKVGVALLPETSPQELVPALPKIDHVLIFSGDLGRYGGHANTSLLSKVHFLRQHKKNLEIGWDGGVNIQNISQLAFGGIDVFNVGGSIVNAENPEKVYVSLQRIADETGTT